MIIVACLVNVAISGATPYYEMMTGNLVKENSSTYSVDFSGASAEMDDNIQMKLKNYVITKDDCVIKNLEK